MLGNVNPLMSQLGSKSPNLQSPPQSNLQNNLGLNAMAMSIANNGPQAMGSMQGKLRAAHSVFYLSHTWTFPCFVLCVKMNFYLTVRHLFVHGTVFVHFV